MGIATHENVNASAALYEKFIEVRWADCDANRHMRHTAYSDMAAHTRIAFLSHIGLTDDWYTQRNLGPVLFREETDFKREVHMGDALRVTVEVGEPTGFSKSIQIVQRLYNSNEELAAIHRCVFGVMDLSIRKIVELPDELSSRFPITLPEPELST